MSQNIGVLFIFHVGKIKGNAGDARNNFGRTRIEFEGAVVGC